MSDSKITDQTVRRRFPYPIAASWQRVMHATTDADRVSCLMASNEVVLRTLAAFLLPDYLRGEKAPAVETQIRTLDKPSGGKWLDLIREILRHLDQRSEPRCFFAEAPRWFFASHGGPGEGSRQLGHAVETRNLIIHRRGEALRWTVQQQAKEMHQALWAVLTGLGWLTAYRAFRVRSQEPTRRRSSTPRPSNFFTGKLQFFVGSEERSGLQSAEWDAFLVNDSVYLVDPDASGLLDLRPFLRVLPDPATPQEHLYLFSSFSKSGELLRSHDESGSEVRKRVSSEEGEISFERWLGLRETIDFFGRWPWRAGPSASPAKLSRTRTPASGTRATRRSRSWAGEAWRPFTGSAIWISTKKSRSRCSIATWRKRRPTASVSGAKRAGCSRSTILVSCRRPTSGPCLPGSPFSRCRFFRRGSLHDQVRQHGVPEEKVRGWAEDALEALAWIHHLDIVHRDIKPSNFLLDEEGHACLTDFGIAVAADDRRLTRTLEQMGTLAYMAPEQRTQRDVSGKADVYSLAMVLHELRTGEQPKAPGLNIGGSFGQLLRQMGSSNRKTGPAQSRRCGNCAARRWLRK